MTRTTAIIMGAMGSLVLWSGCWAGETDGAGGAGTAGGVTSLVVGGGGGGVGSAGAAGEGAVGGPVTSAIG